MSSDWLKNLSGVSLTDEQFERIPCPRTELGLHVTYRFSQMFGIMGTFVVGPIVGAANPDTRNWSGIKDKMVTCGTNGLILGLVAGPILTALTMRKKEKEQVVDRCYRLRHNRNQVRVDRYSLLGAACGAAVGTWNESGGVFGGILGMTSGIALATFVNSISAEKPRKQ